MLTELSAALARLWDKFLCQSYWSRSRKLRFWLYFRFCKVNFYHATACNATHGNAVAVLSVCLSIHLSLCLSVRRVYCDKTK